MQTTIPTLNLLVLRTADIASSARFYEALGIRFVKEQHGAGPEHLCGTLGPVVLELYPMGRGEPTSAVRLGFAVPSLDLALRSLVDAGGKVVSPPTRGPWGTRAVTLDPDGHKVELLEVDRP